MQTALVISMTTAAAAALVIGCDLFHTHCPVCRGAGCRRCAGTGRPRPERVDAYLLLALALGCAAAVVAQ